MRLLCLLTIFLLWFAPTIRAQDATPDDIVEVGEGSAVLHEDTSAAEEEAVWDAKRNAVERAAGVFLKSKAVGQDFALESDRIEERINGFVRRWEIVPGSRKIETVGNGKILRLKVRATVALLPVIRCLEDIKDVYNDLERPRVRVEISGDSANHAAQNVLVTALQAQGFEVATGNGIAEITLTGRITATPTLKLGDKSTAFGVGESVAACRVRLNLQIVSAASEESLFTTQSEGMGSSFQSDAEARTEAAQTAATALLEQDNEALLRRLLVRWARERQEGHAVAVQISGLDAKRVALLHTKLTEMRGFCRYITEQRDKKKTTLRFITRLDNRAIRRRLSELRLDNALLNVKSSRGPVILCAVTVRPRLSRK